MYFSLFFPAPFQHARYKTVYLRIWKNEKNSRYSWLGERQRNVRKDWETADSIRLLPSEGKGHTFESCRVRQQIQQIFQFPTLLIKLLCHQHQDCRDTFKSALAESLVYNGAIITAKSEMLSLTDMWKAAGSDETKRLSRWMERDAAQEFIDAVSDSHNVRQIDIIKSRKGKDGETLAHWQIALAYAKYLSPEFHMW